MNTLSHIQELKIAGYKSLKNTCLNLNRINLLIGSNGSGKSNLISFFKLLHAITTKQLNSYVALQGGASDMLYNGRKNTHAIHFALSTKQYRIKGSLEPTATDTIISKEEIQGTEKFSQVHNNIHNTLQSILSWQVYHFHDTSPNAGMRHYEIVQDYKKLREDARNIAPFLLHIKQKFPLSYAEIIHTISLVAPFFDDFILEAHTFGQAEKVNLSWKQKNSDYPMQAYHFSDGTLRFICLTIALLQPNPPAIIIFDEPELGLHPVAIAILAELIHSSAQKSQIIIATQSPLLIDHFSTEDIIITQRAEGASIFKRLKTKELSLWLEDYSLGELFTKNIIQGGPDYE